jgi:hypothetical protein
MSDDLDDEEFDEFIPVQRRPLGRRIVSALSLLLDRQARTHNLLLHINRKVNKIMATQEELNGYAQAISEAVDGLRADFEAFAAAHPDLDTSALSAAVDRLKALDAERPVVEPTPEPEPEPAPEG